LFSPAKLVAVPAKLTKLLTRVVAAPWPSLQLAVTKATLVRKGRALAREDQQRRAQTKA